MPVYSCGFNEFSQVSIAADDQKRGYVSLPMAIDWQAKIGKPDRDTANAAAAADDDDTALPVSIVISWNRIYYLTANGKLCSFGESADIEQQTLQGSINRLACSWNAVYLLSHGSCYISDSKLSVCQCLYDCSQQPHSDVVMMKDEQQASIGADLFWQHFISVATNDVISVGSTFAVTSERNLMKISYCEGQVRIDRALSGFKVSSVSCGKCHTLVLSAIGVVFSCGVGNQGQLGHGGLESQSSLRVIEALEGVRMTSVCAGGWHSMALSDSSDLYVWGWNDAGQLGLLRTTDSRDAAADDGNEDDDDDDDDDDEADLKINVLTLPHVLDLPPIDLEMTSDDSSYIIKLAAGSRHSLALTSDGRAYSWGCNDYGQLGHADLIPRSSPTVIQYFVEQNARVVDVFAGYWNTVFVTQ